MGFRLQLKTQQHVRESGLHVHRCNQLSKCIAPTNSIIHSLFQSCILYFNHAFSISIMHFLFQSCFLYFNHAFSISIMHSIFQSCILYVSYMHSLCFNHPFSTFQLCILYVLIMKYLCFNDVILNYNRVFICPNRVLFLS